MCCDLRVDGNQSNIVSCFKTMFITNYSTDVSHVHGLGEATQFKCASKFSDFKMFSYTRWSSWSELSKDFNHWCKIKL